MLYSEFIMKATELTVTEAENGLYYLEPMWRVILNDNKLSFKEVSDYKTTPNEVKEVLELEVQRRNTMNSVKPYVLNWVHDIITASIEPAIMQEETDYIKNLTEYLRANKEAQAIKEKEEWDKFKQV